MAKDVAKPRSIKVTDAMWERWQAEAKAVGLSVAALIIQRMDEPAAPISSRKALAAFRGDPKMKAVVADGNELKPVAKVLPVTGTEFPARPVYLRGQAPAKGKGKP